MMTPENQGTPIRVLIVEDSDDDAMLCLRALRSDGFEPEMRRVDRAEDFLEALSAAGWDIVLCDYSMPAFSGSEALELLRKRESDLPFIFVSGTIGEEYAVAAMRNGAQDYVTKQNLRRLGVSVRRALEELEERRRNRSLENQLRQAQKMEVVGQLAGGVAHDFNNMLAAIIGSLELLEEDEPQTAMQRENVADALRAARQAAELVKRLLAFSRRQALQPKVCDLGEQAREALPLLQRTIGDHIRIDFRASLDIWPCFVDPPQVIAAISNLAVNGRDAMPDGGTLTIEADNVSLTAAEARAFDGASSGDYARLSVTDTGTGIAADVLPKVFEPFFTTKEIGKGTGLGLSMVYGFARQSGGFATIESEPGRGTAVRLYFPRTAVAGAAVEGKGAGGETPEIRRARVLLVEDEETVRATATRMLRALGHDPVAVENGEQALEILNGDDSFDLLFTDLNMPSGLSGLELADEALRIRPGLSVLFTSGNPDFGPQAHRDETSRLRQLVVKPWTKRDLAAAIEAAIDAG